VHHKKVNEFLPAIRALQRNRPFTKQDLIVDPFLLEKDGDIHMYYSPHNEYINTDAKIVIVGITPGWNQMKTAFTQFLKSDASGAPLQVCLQRTKEAASFTGSMRNNLLDMIEQCNIPRALDVRFASDLFGRSRHLLHTTSIIKYPVFFKDKNYTGHQPSIDNSSLLRHYAYKEFPHELAQITSPALVIPLGRTVEQAFFKLIGEHKLPNHCFLTGFPHPSGANGHRHKQFQQQKDHLIRQINAWSNRKP